MAQPLLRRQAGQALPAVALLVPLALLPIAAYAIESARLAAVQARLQETLTLSAEAAAAQLDAASLRAGAGVLVDPAAAKRVATAALTQAEPGAVLDSIAVRGSEVTLAGHETLRLDLGGILQVGGATVRAGARTRLTPGYDSPSSLLPFSRSSF